MQFQYCQFSFHLSKEIFPCSAIINIIIPLKFRHKSMANQSVRAARFLHAISRTNKFSLNELNSINLWLQITNRIKLNNDASLTRLKSDTRQQEKTSAVRYFMDIKWKIDCHHSRLQLQTCWPVWKPLMFSVESLLVFHNLINSAAIAAVSRNHLSLARFIDGRRADAAWFSGSRYLWDRDNTQT